MPLAPGQLGPDNNTADDHKLLDEIERSHKAVEGGTIEPSLLARQLDHYYDEQPRTARTSRETILAHLHLALGLFLSASAEGRQGVGPKTSGATTGRHVGPSDIGPGGPPEPQIADTTRNKSR